MVDYLLYYVYIRSDSVSAMQYKYLMEILKPKERSRPKSSNPQ